MTLDLEETRLALIIEVWFMSNLGYFIQLLVEMPHSKDIKKEKDRVTLFPKSGMNFS